MEVYTITETKYTPAIHFNLSTGRLEISGISVHEFPLEFYEPLLESIDRYSLKPSGHTQVDMALRYFNSSSARVLLSILKKLAWNLKGKSELVVNWFYDKDDEDILETVQDIEELTGIKFNYMPLSSGN